MKVISKYRSNRILKLNRKERPFWIEPIGNNWWFNLRTKEWQQEYPNGEACTSSYYSMRHKGLNNIYSLKAARRKIAKWNVPKGTWFRVSLPYVGYDFKIRK